LHGREALNIAMADINPEIHYNPRRQASSHQPTLANKDVEFITAAALPFEKTEKICLCFMSG
jgi:hypothetical protein